jgi:hypothetical protein
VSQVNHRRVSISTRHVPAAGRSMLSISGNTHNENLELSNRQGRGAGHVWMHETKEWSIWG